MGKDFTSALRPAIVMTILFAALLGIAYPLAMTGIGQRSSRIRPMAAWSRRMAG